MLAACINSGKKPPPVIKKLNIRGMPVSAISCSRKHTAATNHSHEFWLFAVERPWIWISDI
jgi:hypothetical protein